MSQPCAAAASTPVVPTTLFGGRVGLLTPQVPGDDRVVQAPVGNVIDVESVRALGVMADAEGQDVEGQSPGLLVAGDQVDDAPLAVGPGDTGLDAFGQTRPVAPFLVAGEQLVDGLPVSLERGSLVGGGRAAGVGAVVEVLGPGGLVEGDGGVAPLTAMI